MCSAAVRGGTSLAALSMLLRTGGCQRERRDEPTIDDDLTEEAAAISLQSEHLLELFVVERAHLDEDAPERLPVARMEFAAAHRRVYRHLRRQIEVNGRTPLHDSLDFFLKVPSSIAD
jgi:hypothetical protein